LFHIRQKEPDFLFSLFRSPKGDIQWFGLSPDCVEVLPDKDAHITFLEVNIINRHNQVESGGENQTVEPTHTQA
jgi:hypothetical protein